MNIKTIGTMFVFLSLISGIAATPAFGDHTKADVSMPAGSSVPGCETTDECFIPSDVTVDVGGEVTWTNDDTAVHTVTSGAAATGGPDGVFDSSLVYAGSAFTHKFAESGTYDYFCIVHPWMIGIVTVADAMPDDDHGHGEMVMVPDTTPATMMSQDGNYMVNVYPHGEPTTGEMFGFTVVVTDAVSGDIQHLNYDVMAMQNGESILEESDIHAHTGMKEHMTGMLDSDSPVDVSITLQGFGEEIQPRSERTGPMGETIEFSVVPEFGTIAILVLAVAIISIVAVTTRSRLSITPRL